MELRNGSKQNRKGDQEKKEKHQMQCNNIKCSSYYPIQSLGST
jgi:hypothetical protein